MYPGRVLSLFCVASHIKIDFATIIVSSRRLFGYHLCYYFWQIPCLHATEYTRILLCTHGSWLLSFHLPYNVVRVPQSRLKPDSNLEFCTNRKPCDNVVTPTAFLSVGIYWNNTCSTCCWLASCLGLVFNGTM